MIMNTNIAGKKTFISGATSGLVKVAAIHVAGLGANVMVLVRDKMKAEKLIKVLFF